MGTQEWLILLLLSVLWGGSFFFIEIAVNELPPLTIVAIRVSLAAIVLWLFALASGLRPPSDAASWRTLFTVGLINNVIPFTLIVWGQIFITSGLAAILNATTPLFAIIVAGLMLSDERFSKGKLVGVVVGFAGVVVMIGPDALAGLGTNLLAQLAVLAAALSYALAGVYSRRFKRMQISPVIAAAGQVSASAVILIPLALWLEQPLTLPTPSLHSLAAIAALAIFSTAVAYIFYFRLIATAGATNLLLVTFLIPVTAVLLGTLLLGESLQMPHVLGMLLIGIGLIAIDGRLWQLLMRRSRV